MSLSRVSLSVTAHATPTRETPSGVQVSVPTAKPTNWHLKFSIEGYPISLEATICDAIHAASISHAMCPGSPVRLPSWYPYGMLWTYVPSIWYCLRFYPWSFKQTVDLYSALLSQQCLFSAYGGELFQQYSSYPSALADSSRSSPHRVLSGAPVRQSTAASLFLLIIEHFTAGVKSPNHHLVNQAINTWGVLSNKLSWSSYYALEQSHLANAKEKSGSPKDSYLSSRCNLGQIPI
jgi:hypothetical protein